METALAFGFLIMIFYLFVKFAQHECIQDDYEDAVDDVEGRLDWARTRSFFPFGMTAQLEVSCELLGKAKSLWKRNRWHEAYRVSLQSQKAMNRAQSIYISAIRGRQ